MMAATQSIGTRLRYNPVFSSQEETMGNCVHCGKAAGFWKTEHEACAADAAKHQQALADAERDKALASKLAAQALVDDVAQTVHQGGSLVALEGRLLDAIAAGQVGYPQRQAALLNGWQRAAAMLLDDGVLSAEEESRLVQCRTRFDLGDDALNTDGSLLRVQQASTLRRVMAGDAGSSVTVEPGFPVNFQRGEKPVWVFHKVAYFEDRDRKQYQGRSQGISVRVLSGVYVRLGAFKGEPLISTHRTHVDSGMLVVGTQNLYFVGPKKSLRVPFGKIVNFTRLSDGIGIHRDAASAKPQFFQTGDGWFVYNLLINLAQGPE